MLLIMYFLLQFFCYIHSNFEDSISNNGGRLFGLTPHWSDISLVWHPVSMVRHLYGPTILWSDNIYFEFFYFFKGIKFAGTKFRKFRSSRGVLQNLIPRNEELWTSAKFNYRKSFVYSRLRNFCNAGRVWWQKT